MTEFYYEPSLSLAREFHDALAAHDPGNLDLDEAWERTRNMLRFVSRDVVEGWLEMLMVAPVSWLDQQYGDTHTLTLDDALAWLDCRGAPPEPPHAMIAARHNRCQEAAKHLSFIARGVAERYSGRADRDILMRRHLEAGLFSLIRGFIPKNADMWSAP